MFHVRKMNTQDFEFAVELANTMNWNMTPQDFEINMRLEPEGSFVLESGSQRTGLITCISYGKVGWFGNLIVKKKYRRQGLGTQLVQHAINYLKEAGAKTVGIYAYKDLADFYVQLGFKRNTEFVAVKAKAVKAPSENCQELVAITKKNFPTAVNCDSSCFGVSRAKLFNLIFKNPANIGYLALEETETVGFAAAKVYGEVAEIGPLACTAEHPKAAASLLRGILSRLSGLEAFSYLPTAEGDLLAVAKKGGFQEELALVRMYLGPAIAKTCIYSAESLERG